MSPLAEELRRIDGRSYGAYKGLVGEWRTEAGLLLVDRVQGDPFAAPSRLRLWAPAERLGLDPSWWATPARRRALEDRLLRSFAQALTDRSRRRGSGGSGHLAAAAVGPAMLQRTAVRAGPEVELRFTAGLPARGRRIDGRAAAALLLEDLPAALADLAEIGPEVVGAWLACAEEAELLRSQLAPRGLVAFVADGSRLPRLSGVDEAPLPSAVPVRAPETLAVELEGLNGKAWRGLGIPRGVTVVVGGGYHGKSTLLAALAAGVDDHIPGDGRERVVAVRSAVMVQAEEGRAVAGVDLRGLLGVLPGGGSTASFCTADASGSTSQAAAVVEAREAGASLLLIDEDRSASNFLVRDAVMAALVPGDPITPLRDRVQELGGAGVSTVVVAGSSSQWLGVADRVLELRDWRLLDATSRARALAPLQAAPGLEPLVCSQRRPQERSVDPRRGRRAVGIRVLPGRRLGFGEAELDLRALGQLSEDGQLRAIGRCLVWLGERMDGRRTVCELLDELDAALRGGLDAVAPPVGDLALPRRQDVAAALSRLRTLRC